MNQVVCALIVSCALVGCVEEVSEQPIVSCVIEEDGALLKQVGEPLVAISGARWAFWPIEVCWESAASFDLERLVVQDAAALWEEALSEESVRETLSRVGGELPEGFVPVTFTGWGLCESSARGIRIRIEDTRSHVHAFGRDLDGVSGGISLNFLFERDRPYCDSLTDPERRLRCIHIDALHEFGHALGVVHGFDRVDFFDPDCVERSPHGHGNLYLGEYDAESVMTHCRDNRSVLSAADKASIQAWYYGLELFGFRCGPFERP